MYRETGEGQRDTSRDWRNEAACLTVDPELFFPTGKSQSDREQEDKAKTVCGRCTVREQCLHYALETDQNFGVWGGLTEDERRAMKRRARYNRGLGGAATRAL